MPTSDQTVSFATIVAGFTDELRCDAPTHDGGQCLRPARWRISVHGCEQGNLCGHHAKRWERATRADLLSGTVWCGHCGRVFSRFGDAAKIVAI